MQSSSSSEALVGELKRRVAVGGGRHAWERVECRLGQGRLSLRPAKEGGRAWEELSLASARVQRLPKWPGCPAPLYFLVRPPGRGAKKLSLRADSAEAGAFWTQAFNRWAPEGQRLPEQPQREPSLHFLEPDSEALLLTRSSASFLCPPSRVASSIAAPPQPLPAKPTSPFLAASDSQASTASFATSIRRLDSSRHPLDFDIPANFLPSPPGQLCSSTLPPSPGVKSPPPPVPPKPTLWPASHSRPSAAPMAFPSISTSHTLMAPSTQPSLAPSHLSFLPSTPSSAVSKTITCSLCRK